MNGTESLFALLHTSLRDAQRELSGTAGRRVAAMGASPGPAYDLARSILSSLGEVLGLLHDATGELESLARTADALAALLEVGRDSLAGTSSSLDNLAPEGPVRTALIAIGAGLRRGAQALDTGQELLRLLPTPEQLAELRSQLSALLGARVDPAGGGPDADPGSLGAVMRSVGLDPPSPPASNT